MTDVRPPVTELALKLVGSAAHELRGPLGVIRATTYLLRRLSQGGDARSGGYLDQIDREVERSNRVLTELMEDLRDPEPQVRVCGLDEVFDRVLDRVPVEGEVQLERVFADSAGEVMADPGQLERTLAALVRRALRAMPDGGRLRVASRRLDGRVVIELSDTGAGLETEEVDRIFHVPETGGVRNVELGLVLAERRARRHGGSLVCESRPGEGTTFRLTLPSNPVRS